MRRVVEVGISCARAFWISALSDWSAVIWPVPLTSMRGSDLLRVKGIVHVAGERGPVVLQGAQHVFHPPVTLEPGKDTDPRSRIVFIVRNIPRESIEALFAAVGALGN